MRRAAYRPHTARDSELLIAGPSPLEGPASRRAARPAALPQDQRGGQKERRGKRCNICVLAWSALLLWGVAFWIGVVTWVLM